MSVKSTHKKYLKMPLLMGYPQKYEKIFKQTFDSYLELWTAICLLFS